MSCSNYVPKSASVIEKYAGGIPYSGIPPADLAVLMAARHHSASQVRNRARQLLAQSMRHRSKDVLSLLTHPDAGVRQEAVNTIGDTREPRYIRAIAGRLLYDGNAWVRARAAYALARMGDQSQVVEYLEQARNDAADEVRMAVQWALSNCYRTEEPPNISMTYQGNVTMNDIQALSDEAIDARIQSMEAAYREAFTSPRAEQEMEADQTLRMFRRVAEQRFSNRAHRPPWSGSPFGPFRRDAALEFAPYGEGLYDEEPEAEKAGQS